MKQIINFAGFRRLSQAFAGFRRLSQAQILISCLIMFTSERFNAQCTCEEVHTISGSGVISLNNWINTHPNWPTNQQNLMIGGCLQVNQNISLLIDRNFEFAGTQTKGKTIVNLIDVTGRKVYSEFIQEGNLNIVIPTEELKTGIYFYQIQFENRLTSQGKIQVIH
jgi:Secretion system C-terminal sorting domain